MDHLSHALPTKNIFKSLVTMPLNPKLEFDMLKVIVKWLEVSFRECNRQLETPQTNNPICSRDLVPSDRASCTISSYLNFVTENLNYVTENLN